MSGMWHESECCDAPILASLGDGVLIGSCSGCGKNVIRKNPRTGALEWLDGRSPWTHDDDLRPARPSAAAPGEDASR